MGDTFGDVARNVRLRVPMAPILLVEDWVRSAFRRAWNYRKPTWSFARAESGFVTNAQKSGTVSVTHGSAFVVALTPPGGLSLASTDELRQFRAGPNQPVYSIECVDVGLSQIELDRPYLGATSASIDARIFDGYITMPEDFERFLAVLDPSNFYSIRFNVTDEELNLWDPQRSSTGTPWALASRRRATLTPILDRIQYELWPYSASFHEYWYFYVKQFPSLTEDDVFPGLFAQHSDIIRAGALVEAASWPGTEDRKNPYFNLALARELDTAFIKDLASLEVRDEDTYPTWWQRVKWNDRSFHPFDSRYLQSHDVHH